MNSVPTILSLRARLTLAVIPQNFTAAADDVVVIDDVDDVIVGTEFGRRQGPAANHLHRDRKFFQECDHICMIHENKFTSVHFQNLISSTQ